MQELPEHFTCATCCRLVPLDSLCVDASTAVILRCMWCCGCLTHQHGDVAGTVVFAGSPLTWRGLDGSAWRTRRHR